MLSHTTDDMTQAIFLSYASQGGDAEAAFYRPERGFAQRDSGVAFVMSWWMFEPLRADARWSAFVKKMGV